MALELRGPFLPSEELVTGFNSLRRDQKNGSDPKHLGQKRQTDDGSSG